VPCQVEWVNGRLFLLLPVFIFSFPVMSGWRGTALRGIRGVERCFCFLTFSFFKGYCWRRGI